MPPRDENATGTPIPVGSSTLLLSEPATATPEHNTSLVFSRDRLVISRSSLTVHLESSFSSLKLRGTYCSTTFVTVFVHLDRFSLRCFVSYFVFTVASFVIVLSFFEFPTVFVNAIVP